MPNAKEVSSWRKKRRLAAGVPDVTEDKGFTYLPLPEYGEHSQWSKTSMFIPRKLHQTLAGMAAMERARRLRGKPVDVESTGEISEIIRRLLVLGLSQLGMDWNAPHEVQEWYQWLHETPDGQELIKLSNEASDAGLNMAQERRGGPVGEHP